MGKVCYKNTREGVDGAAFWCSKWVEKGGMWLSKVSRRAFKSNAISNIFIRFCIRCNYLYGAWLFRFLRKRKGWKPLLRLGFQPLLSSVKVRYFLLKSKYVKRLEKRLPKRHGGSHTPPEDRRARSSGAGCGYLRQRWRFFAPPLVSELPDGLRSNANPLGSSPLTVIKINTIHEGWCSFLWRRKRDSNPRAFWANGFQGVWHIWILTENIRL